MSPGVCPSRRRHDAIKQPLIMGRRHGGDKSAAFASLPSCPLPPRCHHSASSRCGLLIILIRLGSHCRARFQQRRSITCLMERALPLFFSFFFYIYISTQLQYESLLMLSKLAISVPAEWRCAGTRLTSRHPLDQACQFAAVCFFFGALMYVCRLWFGQLHFVLYKVATATTRRNK